MSRSRTVWDKFDIEDYKVALRASATQSAVVAGNPKPELYRWGWMRNRSFGVALTAFATLLWLYALIKLFISDIDRLIVASASPSWGWVLDFRFFILLTVTTIFVLVVHWWQVLGIMLYIGFFPFVVLLWIIPRLYYRRRSWNLVIGTVQVLWSLGQSFKFGLGAFTTFALATLVITLDGPDWLLWSAVVILLALWTVLVYRAVVYAIVPSKFMRYQQKILSAILESDRTWSLAALPSAAKDVAVTRLQKGQIDQLVSQASWGLLLYGGTAHWAEKLDQYRKSGVSIFFSAFAVVALFAQAVLIFTIINLGLYHIDKSQFSYSQRPQAVAFIRHSLASMYAGEIEAIQAVGTVASVVNIVETFSCMVIVAVLVVSVVFSYKQTRDDRVARESIQAMREKADAFAEKLTREYKLPLVDLLDRVSELGGFLGDWGRRLVYTSVAVHRRVGEVD